VLFFVFGVWKFVAYEMNKTLLSNENQYLDFDICGIYCNKSGIELNYLSLKEAHKLTNVYNH